MIERYLTVTAITKYLKKKIDMDPHLKDVWIKGELSNFKHHSRGHMYFTLKDEQSRLQAVMFASNNRHLKFQPESGMNVLIKGYVSVYEPYGQYQLYVTDIQPDGTGALYLAYEQLKEKLRKKGYFSEERKRTIPIYPKHIGIVTSSTGAAIRDILTTLKRRYPIAKTTLIPATVQGDQAAPSIKQAIERANALNMFDVLIVGRGGGSLEELWGFNEEQVADAIYNSNIPVVSAVGHETDTTISDLVADLRAPTPTAAAELVVPSQDELKQTIQQYRRFLDRQMITLIKDQKARLDQMRESYAFRYPERALADKEQSFDKLYDRLNRQIKDTVHRKNEQFNVKHSRLKLQHPKEQVSAAKEKYITLQKDQQRLMEHILQTKAERFQSVLDKLSLVNPLNIMKRGFAIPYREGEEIIHSGQNLKVDEEIHLRFQDSVVDCKVLDVKELNND